MSSDAKFAEYKSLATLLLNLLQIKILKATRENPTLAASA